MPFPLSVQIALSRAIPGPERLNAALTISLIFDLKLLTLYTYAVNSIKAGDDIKTLQENLGHATAAFTMQVYAHVTEQMKQASADRMEQYIRGISGL